MVPLSVDAQSPPVQVSVSDESPSQALELTGVGLVHVLVLVDLHSELHVVAWPQGAHPPLRTQLGWLVGVVRAEVGQF